jgi:predicted RNA-binding Zn-ribbon protein involved in translation (DUF1610 family)
LDIPDGNIIFVDNNQGEDIRLRKLCGICDTSMTFIENSKSFRCPKCFYEISADQTRPKSQLTTVQVSEGILVQSDATNDDDRDIPSRYRRVKDHILDEDFMS